MTHLKPRMNIDIEEFLRGVFVMKVAMKFQQVFFKTMMNHISNNIINNSKLINLKENQDIKKLIGGEPISKKGLKWLLLK